MGNGGYIICIRTVLLILNFDINIKNKLINLFLFLFDHDFVVVFLTIGQ